MTVDTSFLIKAMQYEHDKLTEVLQGFTGYPDTIQTDPITAEDLDRKTRAEEEWAVCVEAIKKNASQENIAVDGAIIHETDRARRDMLISETSHKRIMLSCLKTARGRAYMLKDTVSNLGKNKGI